MSQHKKLVIALFSAIILGVLLHPFSNIESLKMINTHLLQPVGQIFLRMIFMVVVPLIFSALVIAANELGMSHGIAKVVKKTLAYTFVISTLSVLIGISLVNIIKPGTGFVISAEQKATLSENTKAIAKISENVAHTKPLSQIIVELIPKNPLDSAVRALDGEMIPLMIFALIFGIALSLVARRSGQENGGVLIPIFEQVFAISMRILSFAMVIAPYGVFALVFNTIFVAGYGILLSLFLYVFTVVLALLIQQFVVYSSALKFVAKRNPWHFFKHCQDVYLYAFSTSSSNATLPKSLEVAETKLGIPSQISRFVLTVGATANQNGTAIFEGVTVLFLAQVYGVDLSMAQQIQVVLFSILAGMGTAGVPGGSLPLIMILLQSVGIPPEGIGLILGVDRFLDMCRTTINVSGDLVIAAMVAPRNEKL
ncbi:MAG: Proton glutamate symport protein [bacterium ADurb.BinA186]|nr:MAG: Proton glutamate symport protein [bacterium ADurb.BinA186]